MAVIRSIYDKKLQYIIKNDPVLAEEKDEDNNNISILLSINNLLKIFKLVLIILSVSYFLGFLVQMVSELGYDYQVYSLKMAKEYMNETDYKEWENIKDSYNWVTFFEEYGMVYNENPDLTAE